MEKTTKNPSDISSGDDAINSTSTSGAATAATSPNVNGATNRIPTSKEYTESVRQWLWQYHMHCATHQFMQSAMQLNFAHTAMMSQCQAQQNANNAGSAAGTGMPMPPAGMNGMQQPAGLQQQRQVSYTMRMGTICC